MNTSGFCLLKERGDLSTEAVDGSSLALEGVDDVKGGDGLAAGVFCVGDRVTDDGLQERLEHSTGLLVDESGDSLDSSAAGETANGRLGDSLDVIAQNLAVALGSSLAESLSSFTSSGHGELVSLTCEEFVEWLLTQNIALFTHLTNRICLEC